MNPFCERVSWCVLPKGHDGACPANSHQSVPSDQTAPVPPVVREAMYDAAFRTYVDQVFTFGVFEMTAADEHRIREALRKAVDAALTAALRPERGGQP